MKQLWRRLPTWVFPALILALVVFVAVCNLIWTTTDLRPPHWDMGRHLWTSLFYLNSFKQGHYFGLITEYRYYPPFVYWVTVPFYLVIGLSDRVAILSNIFFIGVLAFSTYGLGKELWSRRVGLLAAITVLGFPMLVSQFKEYQVDAPLTAIVALALYLLIKTKEFSDRRFSVILGVAIGFGMLTKWTFLFPLFLPLLYAVGLGLYRAYKKRDWAVVGNIAFVAIIAYAIAGVWYVINHQQILIDLTVNNGGAAAREGDPLVGSSAANLWYFWNLLNTQVYLVPLLAFVTGVVVSSKHWKKQGSRILYPLLLVISTYLIFTFVSNKDARYTLPLLSGVALIAVWWVDLLKAKWRNGASIVIALYGIVTFLAVSFGTVLLPKDWTLHIDKQPITIYGQHGYLIGPPAKEQWYQEWAFQTIAAAQPIGIRTVHVDMLDSIWFNNWGIRYFSDRYAVSLVQPDESPSFYLIRSQSEPVLPAGFKSLGRHVLPDASILVVAKSEK